MLFCCSVAKLGEVLITSQEPSLAAACVQAFLQVKKNAKVGAEIPDIEALRHLLRGFANGAVILFERGGPVSCERDYAGSFVIRVLSEPDQTLDLWDIHALLGLLVG